VADETTDKGKGGRGRTTRATTQPRSSGRKQRTDAEKKKARELSDKKKTLASKALIALRDANQAQYDQIAAGLFKEAGLVYQRRVTPEEREQQTLRELIAKHPDQARALTANLVNPSGPAVDLDAQARLAAQPDLHERVTESMRHPREGVVDDDEGDMPDDPDDLPDGYTEG
jgi:hypothetical protein